MAQYRKTRSRARRRALSSGDLPLFQWADNRDLLANPAVRRLMRAGRISPALAGAYAEIIGLGRPRER